MANAKLDDLPKINTNSPEWAAVERWTQAQIEKLRAKREDPDADQRKLDIALGSILALKMLEQLPEAIRRAHEKEPVLKSDFGIPAPDEL
jgi:hypothetical protein